MDVKLQKRHSNILKQIHKLKSENRTLSSRRIVVIDRKKLLSLLTKEEQQMFKAFVKSLQS